MLPAEKTHYRKGLALGMTLAETFSVIVFILLLTFALLFDGREKMREEAQEALNETQEALNEIKEELDETKVDLRIAETMLLGGDPSWVNTDAWFEETRRLRRELEFVEARAENAELKLAEAEARADDAEALLSGDASAEFEEVTDRASTQAAQLATLRNSLQLADERLQEAEARQQSLNARLVDAEGIANTIRAEVARREDLTPAQADLIMAQAAQSDRLSRDLEAARGTIASLNARWREAERLATGTPANLLRAELNRSERARAAAVGRAEYREDEIRRLSQGTGVDPPPCWMDDERRPEHIFRIELTDAGMRLFRIVPPEKYADDPAARYADEVIEDGQEYSPDEFLRRTRPIHDMGRDRTDAFGPDGCRFWVRPVDRTGASKAVFRARADQLGRHFWFRW